MICFGVANSIAAGITGPLVAKFGRVSVSVIIALLNFCLFGYIYFWEAKENDYLHYCAFAALWGICDGAWLVLVNGKLKSFFKKL